MTQRPRRTTVAALLFTLALLPTGAALRSAWAQEGDEANEPETELELGSALTKRDELSKRVQRVLAELPTNEASLINVTRRELPASPDILNLGKRATRALARCVADNVDNGVRKRCATVLGRLGDRSALPALQSALEAWSEDVRGAALAALAKMPDASSFQPLQTLTLREDEEPANVEAAYLALGTLNDPRALKLLRETFHSPDTKHHVAAFRGIWRSRHRMARSTLLEEVKRALTSNDSYLVRQGEFAAAELKASELVASLVPLMESSDMRTRNRAVYALGRIGDKAATKALLERIPKVREARMLNNIAFALERLDPEAFFRTTKGLIAHKQASIRMNTAFVLGDVQRAEGVPQLLAALHDPNDFVRVSAAAALRRVGSKDAIPALEQLVESPNRTLQEEAILSLYALSNGARKDLVWDKLYLSRNASTKLRATLALAQAKDPRVSEDVLACLQSRRCSVDAVDGFLRAPPDRALHGRLLLDWVRGDAALTPYVALAKPPGVTPLATSILAEALLHGYQGDDAIRAIDLLGDVGDSNTPKTLLPLLRHDNSNLRLHAAVELARFDVPEAHDADAVLFADLDNLAADWLPPMARLLGRVPEAKSRARLLAGLLEREKSADVPLAMAAAAVHLEWEPEVAIFRFTEALASGEVLERELATRYLLRAAHPLVTSLLRRALARETRDVPAGLLRKVLDARSGTKL